MSINRKYNSAQKILNWERPINIKKIDFERKRWTDYEDYYIINNDISESIENLKRTKQSIKMRLFRLKLK